MLNPRIIPVLLVSNRGLYKTIRFKNPTYIGDPLNAVRIFNEKEVDELIKLQQQQVKWQKIYAFSLIGFLVVQTTIVLVFTRH